MKKTGSKDNKGNNNKLFTKRNWRTLYISVIIISFLVLYFLISPRNAMDYYFSMILSLVPSVISYYLFSTSNNRKAEEEARNEYENLRDFLGLSIISQNVSENEKRKITEYNNEKETDRSSDILEFMLANMKELRDYYALSKAQAKNSFFLTVLMCITGFILIGISASAAFFDKSDLAPVLVPAVGGVIVELISVISLLVYRKSLDQLNFYYTSLHSNERFLSIVNIVSKISLDKRDEMYCEIIKSQIELVDSEPNKL